MQNLRQEIKEIFQELFAKKITAHQAKIRVLDAVYLGTRAADKELSELRESNRRQGEEIERLRLELRVVEIIGLKLLIEQQCDDLMTQYNNDKLDEKSMYAERDEFRTKYTALENELAELESQLQLLNNKKG